jgi:hypothetical protein
MAPKKFPMWIVPLGWMPLKMRFRVLVTGPRFDSGGIE